MNEDKIEDWEEAYQWLERAAFNLGQALNKGVSDCEHDIAACKTSFKSAVRNLEEACLLLGMEVTIPALEEEL